MDGDNKRIIAITALCIATLLMALSLGFELKWLLSISFIISLLGSGLAISNNISYFRISYKNYHIIITLLLGMFCLKLDTIATTIIGVILLCLSSGLLIDRLLPTKNN